MQILSVTENKVLPDGTVVQVPLRDYGIPFEKLLAAQYAAGNRLWELLHRHALTHDCRDDTRWLDAFSSEIPYSCCGEDWHKWKAAHPPRWDDYFAWTVEAHNAVNLRLGKSAMEIAQARRFWTAKAS